MPITSRDFGQLPSGEMVTAYRLANEAGASVEVLTLGGIVRALSVPDRAGELADVVLGFHDLAGYLAPNPYFGAIIGRLGGRVTGGQITVEGRSYSLAQNDGANHLHGGLRGLDKRLWTAQPVGETALRLSYSSPDGEEGYPGALEIAVTYTLTAAHEFIIETEATSDRPTPLSLTHHSYFNLAGEGSGPVADHELQICAETFVPTRDATMTLTDRRTSVVGRPEDFRRARCLGEAMPTLFAAHGDLYLSGTPDGQRVARVVEPRSGRVLEVFSDEPCLQLYTGAALDGSLVGKSGRAYAAHAGLCLECEGYPNGTDHPEFGDILVRPGTPQRRRTIYHFSTSA